MDTLKIIFWVCVVDAFIGHLPWTAPLAVFGVAILIGLLDDNNKKKKNDELREKINKIGNRKR